MFKLVEKTSEKAYGFFTSDINVLMFENVFENVFSILFPDIVASSSISLKKPLFLNEPTIDKPPNNVGNTPNESISSPSKFNKVDNVSIPLFKNFEFKNIFENSCQVEDKVFKLACTVSK